LLTNSLKRLFLSRSTSKAFSSIIFALYSDGWSISFYNGTTAFVARSEKPSHVDDKFDKTIEELTNSKSNIVIGHLRRASSGCVEGVPNPHPFQRFQGTHNWLFGHNGGISKDLLMELIGEEYLTSHPPQTCTDNAPDSWVDSELYFIYLLKHIEEVDDNVKKGLKNALRKLTAKIDKEDQYLNFFLTDGKKVWAFRKGTSLYYTYGKKDKVSIISSTIPGEDQFKWKEFPKNKIGILERSKKPRFTSLR